MDRCDVCTFVYDSVPLSAVPDRLRSLPALYEQQLRQADGAGLARLRPQPEVWSTLEYTCHVRDVLRVQRARLLLALREKRPTFASMRRDERAIEERYNEQDVDAVLAELAAAAAALADVCAALDGDQWQRVAVYNWPVTSDRNMAWLARHTIHEGAHHLMDVARGIDSLRLRQREPARGR